MSNLLFNSNKNDSVIKVLTKNYGIGQTLAHNFCKKIGICSNYKLSNLNTEQIENFKKELSDSKLKTNQELKKILFKNFEQSLQIKSYKGLRKIKGYPANGQRTRSNAKTARKKYFVK